MTLLRIFGALSIAVLTLVIVGVPGKARADDGVAREFFRQGVALYDKKQYAAALESFRAAYAEKPSPGIKQNIALSLKGLGQNVEAATAFDEALDEGADTLKPSTRAAMELELAELSKIVATVRLKIVFASDQPIDNVIVTVDKKPLSRAAVRRPVRLQPGIHVFTAEAPGVANPPEKKLSILAGSPVDATFELGAAAGVLIVKPSVPDAVVKIDGAEVGRGVWSGRLPAGNHQVTVSAPGFQTTTAEVAVSTGTTVEFPIALPLPGVPPPIYDRPPAKKPEPELKRRYVVPMLAYNGQSMRLATILGERSGGTSRSFTGASFGVRAGYRVSRIFALEIYGDAGQLSESYALPGQLQESETKVVHWQLTPVLRFATSGSFRFTIASGVGVHGLSLDADIKTGSGAGAAAMSKALTGKGISASWLVDLGMQLDAGPLFLEGVAFFDMHGVGIREEVTDARLLLSSPGTRAGIRAGIGINF